MKKLFLTSTLIAILIVFLSCTAIETSEPVPTPDTYIEEELAAQAIAMAKAEKTQRASREVFYAKISDGDQTYLAFWFAWNTETILLPLAILRSSDSRLITCQVEPATRIAIGELVTGMKLTQGECVTDDNAPENAIPIIKIPGHFEEGIKINSINNIGEKPWNIINLHGKYAQNLSTAISFVVKNDFSGSGDLSLSLHRASGPGGDYDRQAATAPTYTLSTEALQVVFSNDQLDFFEQSEDVVYELEKEFAWKIPTGSEELELSQGDQNWFVLQIRETKSSNKQEEEYLAEAYIQIIGVGAPPKP